jgi:2-aminoadipate transaminase
VAFTPGRPFFVEGGGERTLRLSFSSVAARRIDEGVKRLADTVKAALKRPRAASADRAPVPVV